MYRFWIFPLFVAFVGTFYGAFCDAQGWLAYYFGGSIPIPGWLETEITNTFFLSAPWGGIIGLVVGAVAAWSELLRRASTDRSGLQALGRLISNGIWLGIYALLANALNALLFSQLLRLGLVSATSYRYWFPAFYFLLFGTVNLSAIIWTLMRTVSSDEVLTPRVLLSKLRGSVKAIA